MRSIYLYDSSLRMIRAIEQCKFIRIHTVTTQGHYYHDSQLIKKSNPFLAETTFMSNAVEEEGFPDESLELDYEVIESFRSTQYRVEQYMARLGIEQYKTQYLYYRILSYFHKRFLDGSIDGVITVLPLHGSPLEMIPIDLSIKFGVPVYTIDKLFANPDGFVLWGIWDYTLKQYVDLGFQAGKINLDNYLYYKTKRTQPEKGIPLYATTLSGLSGSGKVRLVLSTLFLKDSQNSRSVINSLMNKFPRAGFFYLYRFNPGYRHNYRALRKARKTYRKLSSRPDLERDFIYYPLHLDPEASTLVREQLSNQLSIIRMISDSLPEGFKIYVKEHPAVFDLLKKTNLRDKWYFFYSLSNYRGASYYQEVLKMGNVILVSMDYSSEKLAEKAKAVATINGTIGLEAATVNKPVLLFGNKTPLTILHGIFSISSSKDCKEALNKIKKGFQPDYDLDTIKKFLFEMHVSVDVMKSEYFDPDSTEVKNLGAIIENLMPE